MLSFSASAVHDLSSSRHCPFGGQGSQASTYQQNLRISWCSISPISQPVKLAICSRSHRNQGRRDGANVLQVVFNFADGAKSRCADAFVPPIKTQAPTNPEWLVKLLTGLERLERFEWAVYSYGREIIRVVPESGCGCPMVLGRLRQNHLPP